MLKNTNTAIIADVARQEVELYEAEGRHKATLEAAELGHQPTSQEIDNAVKLARLEHEAALKTIRDYLQSNAAPYYGLIALTISGLTAIMGALLAISYWPAQRAKEQTSG